MGGLCSEGHEFLKICKKKDVAATLRMMDVLVTQHSKRTAKRVRRALFGQSFVDFNANPWTTSKSSGDSIKPEAKKKTKKKQSRLEREFSQEERRFSQATTIVDSTPVDEFSDSPFRTFSSQKAGTATEQQSSLHLSSNAAHIEEFSHVSCKKCVNANTDRTEFFQLSP